MCTSSQKERMYVFFFPFNIYAFLLTESVSHVVMKYVLFARQIYQESEISQVCYVILVG